MTTFRTALGASAAGLLAVLIAAAPMKPGSVHAASDVSCEALRATRSLPATGVARDDVAERNGLRAFAIQFKQDIRHVESYAAFRTKMRCLMDELVVPFLSDDVPNLVVFNEDIGLATLAVGTRGATLRAYERSRAGKGAGDQSGEPLGAAGALGLANGAYAKEVAYYRARFPGLDPRKEVFLAATDTFARAFSQTFSDIARDYGVYVVASNIQGVFRESNDPADIAALADPDLAPVDRVYVATRPEVWNQAILWGPQDVNPSAPAPERNLLFRNAKVPITRIESEFLALDEGPSTGLDAAANIGPAPIPGTGALLGFATSLPAFVYGYPMGSSLPAGTERCADVRRTYMPCMDALGVNVVIQAEANPLRWGGLGGRGQWQPFEWMRSTWRAVADPTVGFDYNITPHLVGNLLDLTFDGQSAITARHGGYPPRHYTGNTWEAALADDHPAELNDPEAAHYLGSKDHFVVLAPWLTTSDDRDVLRTLSARLAPGSDDPLENDYLETAIWADLVF